MASSWRDRSKALRRRPQRRGRATFEPLESRRLLAAESPELLASPIGSIAANANSGAYSMSTAGAPVYQDDAISMQTFYNYPALGQSVQIGDTLFFVAGAPGYPNYPIWILNAQTMSFSQLQGIGGDSRYDARPTSLARVGDELWFGANYLADGVERSGLWKANSTGSRVELIQGFTKGNQPKSITEVGGKAYFTLNSSTSTDAELWQSDGTAAGTRLVRRFEDGARLESLWNFKGTLVFTGYTAKFGDTPRYELWKSDGTAAGTVPFIGEKRGSLVVDQVSGSGAVEKVRIIASGERFAVGGLIAPESFGSAGSGVTLVASRVGEAGELLEVTVRNGGSGYNVGDTLTARNQAGVYLEYGFKYAILQDDFLIEATGRVRKPTSPQGLVARGGDGDVGLSWVAPVNDGGSAVTDYVVECSANGGSTWTTVNDGVSANTSAVVTGLTNGVGYIFRVSALNIVGRSNASAQTAPVTPTGGTSAPSIPTSVAGTAGNNAVFLEWQQPSHRGAGIVDYVIESSVDGGTKWNPVVDQVSPATWARITGLANDTTYVFRVSAKNSAGTGMASLSSNAITPSASVKAPTAPANMSLIPGDRQVSLTWTAPADDGGSRIVDYKVEYSANNSTWVTFDDGRSTLTTATVTGLPNDTTYYFRVSAVNACGDGTATAAATAIAQPYRFANAALWRSVGTTGQLSLLKSDPNGYGAVIKGLVKLGDQVIFGAQLANRYGGSEALELWRTDGTTDGTVLIKTKDENGHFLMPSGLVAFGDSVYFRGTGAIDDSRYRVVWRTDGTPEGTVKAGFASGPGTNTNGTMFWIDSGVSLMRSDGTAAGTRAVAVGGADGFGPLYPSLPIDFQGTLFLTTSSIGGTSTMMRIESNLSRPAAPDHVVAAPLGATSAQVSWNRPAFGTAADFVVEVSVDNGSTWSLAGTSGTMSTTVSGLQVGRNYVFRVQGRNAARSGSFSAVSNAVTLSLAPRAPTGLSATAQNGDVNLSWAAPENDGRTAITDYEIQYSVNSGSTWTTYVDGLSPATTATVKGLPAGVGCVFRVAAINSGGRGEFSVSSSVVTPRPTPGPPTNVVGTPGNTQVTLSWTAPTDNGGSAITDYVVQFKATTATTWNTFSDGISTNTSATVTGLQNGTAYVFRVLAVNSAGTGAASNDSASVTPAYVVPAAPTNVVGTPGNTQVTLSWTAPTDNGGSAITDYVVQFKTTAATTWNTFNDGTSTSTSAIVTGLQNGTAYVFRVSAANLAGAGAVSNSSGAVTPRTIPGVPTGVSGSPTNGTGEVRLVWTAPANNGGSAITDYVVQFKTVAATTWNTFNDGTSTNTSATVTGLANGTGYLFRVSALNSAGQGGFSTQSSLVTPRTVPSAPRSVKGTAGNGRVALSWTAPSSTGGAAITDYLIQYSIDNGANWINFTDTVSTKTSVTVTGLTNGTRYVFRVAAINAAGTGPWSSPSAGVAPRR